MDSQISKTLLNLKTMRDKHSSNINTSVKNVIQNKELSAHFGALQIIEIYALNIL